MTNSELHAVLRKVAELLLAAEESSPGLTNIERYTIVSVATKLADVVTTSELREMAKPKLRLVYSA